jgi:cellulose biosynthesis protein BcsQ
MGTGDNKFGANPAGGDDQLAKDVARLYSWAHVEGVPYRDFSHQRRLQQKQPSPPADDQKIETSPNPPEAAEPGVIPFKPVDADAPVTSPPQPEIRSAPAQVSAAAPSPAHQLLPDTMPLPASKTRTRAIFIDQQPSPSTHGGTRPALAVHSIAGGVGKTTLCANLARVLCSQGEQVLLMDASGSGTLPFYFGANDLRPGLRKFVAPGMTYSPLHVLGSEEITAEWLNRDVKSAMLNSDRAIFDLGPASFCLLPEIFAMCSTLLVPLLPDLNSILTIPRLEASLNKMRSTGFQVPVPYYVFTEFDRDNPMDQRACDLVTERYGERLLPFTIRYGKEVGEAIASRMTVVDLVPESQVARDYIEVAAWLQTVAPARQAAKASGRWTEQ